MPAFTPFTTTSPTSGNLHPRASFFRRDRNRVATGTRCSRDHDPLDAFDWPVEPTLEAVGDAIAAACGLDLIVMPIPDEMRHPEVSGLTTINGQTAHVFYDADHAPLNQETTILHEYAHILHRDIWADSDCTHLRSMFDSPREKRAETTGMRLLEEMHRQQKAARKSEILDFFSGTDESTGL